MIPATESSSRTSHRTTKSKNLRAALLSAPLLASLAVGGLSVVSTPANAAVAGAAPAAGPAASAQQSQAQRKNAATGSAGVLALDWGDIDSTPDAAKGNYVVINPWERKKVAELKKANPAIKVLMYKDASATVKRACRNDACTKDNWILPTGVGYHFANQRRPGWFLHDNTGQQIEWSDWDGLYAMNIKRRSYQKAWARRVIRELRKADWDGVMIDDTLTYLSHDTVGNKVPVEISTDDQMYAATESFLKRVGGKIKRKGFMAVPNITVEWNTWERVMNDWTRYVSGWENEYFVKWGLDKRSRFVGADWEWKMSMASWLAERNVPLLAITYSNLNDVEAQIYHRATWLLTWNGRTGSSIFVPDEGFTNHWIAKPTIELGQPSGSRFKIGDSGVYRRNYDDGVVLVNPTTETKTVSLGSTYETLEGKRTSTVTIEPTSGAILRK